MVIDRTALIRVTLEKIQVERDKMDRQVQRQLWLSDTPEIKHEVTPIRNSEETGVVIKKPARKTGLWTSTWREETQDSDWVEWCRGNDYGNPDNGYWHLLTPRPDVKLYVIDDTHDLEMMLSTYLWTTPMLTMMNEQYEISYSSYPTRGMYADRTEIKLPPIKLPRFAAIDFEKMSQEYDGIWLTEQGNGACHLPWHSEHDLNSWDCECVLWFRWCFGRVETIKPVAMIAEEIANNGAV